MMSSELIAVVRSFQESVIICRPRDFLSFAERYFNDAKAEDSEELHAIQSLPYLLTNQNAFRNSACTVFCRQLVNSSTSRDVLNGETVMEIVRKMSLGRFWFDVAAVDEAVCDYLHNLSRIDFNLFVACLRFAVSCYQVAMWMRGEISDLHTCELLKGGIATSGGTEDAAKAASGSKALARILAHTDKDTVIDTVKLKSFVQQRYRGSGGGNHGSGSPITRTKALVASPSRSGGAAAASSATRHGSSTCYHMHCPAWTESDCRQWARTLIETIDDLNGKSVSGSGSTTIEELVNFVLRKFLTSRE